MFTAIKRFFAPSAAFFSWAEIKEIIVLATELSRRVFWQYFGLFWWVFVLGIAVTVFLFDKNRDVTQFADFNEMVTTWVAAHGLLGVICFLVVLLIAAMAYMSQYFLVRSQPGEVVTFKRLWSKICGHYQFIVLQPLVFMGYSFFGFVGDFYTLIFLDSVPSWSLLFRSLWAGIKLGLRLFPLRISVYLVAWLGVMVPIICGVLVGVGIFALSKISPIAAWFLGVPFGLALLIGLLWSFPRFVFFSLAMQSILYDKVRLRFPELFESFRV